MTEDDIKSMVDAMFKKLDRIESKVDAAQVHNSENYRMLSVLEQRTVGNEARIKRLEKEAESAEAHQVECAKHRGQCPADEFHQFRRLFFGLLFGFFLQTIGIIFTLLKAGSK
jgi:hypothetical protein